MTNSEIDKEIRELQIEASRMTAEKILRLREGEENFEDEKADEN